MAYLVAGLLGGPVAAAADLELRKLTKPDPVPVSEVAGKRLDKTDEAAANPFRPDEKASWPTPGAAAADVPGAGRKAKTLKAGSLPVAVQAAKSAPRDPSAAAQVQVQVLDRLVAESAGVEGVLIAVQGHGGKSTKKKESRLAIEVDYSGFAGMYGGDWASRLTLREVPACAVTTPGEKGCEPGRLVKARNDRGSQMLSAEVDTGVVQAEAKEAGEPVSAASSPVSRSRAAAVSPQASLFAVTAAASGSAGDFTATSLSPSGTWEAGGSSGGFSWAYDIDTPPVPGSLEPGLGLSYSSQSVDGRTAATNNQANWIGDGWSMSPGSIERRYVACEDDNKDGNNPSHKVGDQCWKKDNATLSLGGSSSELVKDDATGEWRKKADDGTRIAQLKSAGRGNGDDDGEYWRVTAPDGTRYYFGYNRLPGWTEGKEETNSTWTVPVFGNHTGEPCRATAFKDSWCQQAWRWNLDYMVDSHSNAMAYHWTKESNSYQRNIDSTHKGTLTSYTRGGHLKRIDYGLRSNRMYADKAAAKVDFVTTERCLETDAFNCAADKFTEANAKKWPDVPFDQVCKTGDKCEGNSSPSYFTRKRLTAITSSALDSGTYKKVDTWTLKHSFPSTGSGNAPPLWLASIGRTGYTAGTAVTMPDVVLYGQQMANRVEGDVDPIPAYSRYRVYAVKNETGNTLGVTYSAPDCKAGSLPAPATNTKRCYPVIWSPPDAPAADYEPYQDWFHTYEVTQILESDNTSGAPVQRTDYTYLGGRTWTKNDDEFTKAKHRTYGNSKGYGRVQTRTGDLAEGAQTLSEARYFRGITGAKIADSEGTEIADHEAFAGMTRETSTYNGSGGALLSATSSTPWRSAATASHARTADGLPTVHAYRTNTQKEQIRSAVTGGPLRRTESSRKFDSYGQPVSESETGDTAKSGDEQCTTTSYARNTDSNILGLIAETTTVAKACTTAPALPDDLVATKRYYYDGSTTLGAAPTKGDETRRDENDGTGTGFITVNSAVTYDAYGRQTSATNAAGAATTVTRTPTTGQAPTQTVTTNELDHTTTEITDPLRGVTTAAIDANGKRTDAEYDALGRVTKVWTPGWSKTGHATLPSAEYSYRLSPTEPNVVTTKALTSTGTYETSYTFYDGMLRPRQTQSAAHGTAGKGRVVTETRYDTRGLAWKTYGAYYADGAPSTTLVAGNDTKVPAGVETLYDGAARPTAQIALKFGDETKRTTTIHGGDRTTVIPPQGGTATTTITDALDRKTESRAYTNDTRTEFQATTYAYTKHGKLAKLTDPAGTDWTWTYDARGRQIEADDPDKGPSSTKYNNSDQPITTTDARGTELTTSYDVLGRAKELKQGSTLRSSWSYDTVAKGQASADTRYVEGKPYTTTVNSYNDRYQPTSSTTSLPESAGALAGDYTWTVGYNEYTGIREWTSQPAMGGLPAERTTTNYGEDDLPIRTTTGGTLLVANVNYDVFSKPVRTEYGTFNNKVYRTQDWDEHTGSLNRRTLDGDNTLRIDDTNYTYDDAGNTTRISSTSGQGAAASTDTQCFTADALRRMTDAWTTKPGSDDCKTGPSASSVGGPDAYWHSYSYDVTGNRTKETQHATAIGSSDITRTYTPDKTGEDHPQHALGSVSTTGGPDDGKEEAFDYDESGNTTSRSGGSRAQQLTWDAEGNLATVTEDGKTARYTYDSDGNRMLARDPDSSTTAYLPGGNELKVTAAGAKTATRYYTHAGETVAVRTNEGISFLFNDHQGTGLIAITLGAGQVVTRRKQLPFGKQRSSTGTTWPGDRGFIGGNTDPTGLTHLGAREYDPQLGRFISVDPLLLTGDQRQHNPYQYGNNNPVTFSDPTGEQFYDDTTGLGYGNVKAWKHDLQAKGYLDKRGNTTPKYKKHWQLETKRFNAWWPGEQADMYREANRRAAAAQKKAADRKAAEAQQKINQKDQGFWGSLADGNISGAGQSLLKGSDNWFADKAGKVAGVYLAADTTGVCVSGSAGFGVGGSMEACLVSTTREGGKTDYGVSFSKGSETPSVGLNATVGLMGSNATDFGQLRGDGWGGSVAGAGGPAASLSHQRAIGAVNYRGEPVGATTVAVGVGAGIEAAATTSHGTMVGHLFTW